MSFSLPLLFLAFNKSAFSSLAKFGLLSSSLLSLFGFILNILLALLISLNETEFSESSSIKSSD